jgi:hypothetical protein
MASPLAPTLKVVRCSLSNPEPAFDEETMVAPIEGTSDTLVSQYMRTRDESLLHFVADATPTWFHLRRLPLAWMAQELDKILTRSSQRILAFRAACHCVEVPGEPLSVVAPKERGAFVAAKGDFGVSLAPMEWVEEIGARFGAEVVQEMGEVAINHSRLPRGARGPFVWWGGSVATH